MTPEIPAGSGPLVVVMVSVAGGAPPPVLAACETTTGVMLFKISCSAAVLATLARKVTMPVSPGRRFSVAFLVLELGSSGSPNWVALSITGSGTLTKTMF